MKFKAGLYIIVLIGAVSVKGQEGPDVFKQAKKNNREFKFNKELRYTAVGINVNAINYFGDLAPRPGALSTDISFTRSGFGLFIQRRVGSRVFIRGALNWATMKGNDFESADLNEEESSDRYARNLQFKNTIYELSGTGVLDLFRNHGFYLKRAIFTPFIYGGVAVFYHNPTAKVPDWDFNGKSLTNAGEWVALQPLGTEGQNHPDSEIDPYSRIQLSLLGGFGARLKLNKNFDLSLEIGYRYLFFDYIDDVSTEYPDYDHLENDLVRTLSGRAGEHFAVESDEFRDPILLLKLYQSGSTYIGANGNTYFVVSDNLPGRQRGDSDDKDIYVVTSLKLSYVLGSPFGKPKFR